MSSIGETIELSSVTLLHWSAVVLAMVTALVHLVLGIDFFPHPMGIAFLLASGGFIGAIVLFLFDFRRRLLYGVGVPFTAIQTLLWYFLNRPAGLADITLIEAVDKCAQTLLIAILIVLYRRES